ncbi:hypothetical protein [Pararhodobacter zhoushanensis]|uniref:Uncharacterized protein n=1 Tax=Pararhodobacter zhoushanensis TaxID=2479545 RepID=A0ABT3GYU8_9RHOB|nr:hypothetical protein [Pararhodobacter zhoushanensis]MCW1932640.1 hypothetical protein [Pararhodobacter zhoushanensis]
MPGGVVHPNHVRAAIDRLGLPVDDIPRADFPAQGAPAMDSPHPAARLSPDMVQQLASTLDKIKRLTAMIEVLNGAHSNGPTRGQFGSAIRELFEMSWGADFLRDGPRDHDLGKSAITGIISAVALQRAELQALVAPYVEGAGT